VASDVMAPILLQRLQSSLGTIHSMMGQLQNAIDKKDTVNTNKKGSATKAAPTASDIIDKQWPSIKEQWSLLSLSLITLAGLIENCPKALQRLGVNSFPQLLAVMPLARTSLDFLSKEMIVSGAEEEKGKKKEMVQPIMDAVTNATRALHSLLDDNRSLITSLPLGNAVSELQNAITTAEFPNIAKLHASGSILSLRRVLVLEKEIETKMSLHCEPTAAALQSCTNDVILPLLSFIFDSFTNDSSDDSPKQLINQMIATSLQLSTIKNDADMEDEIVRKVNSRKEPARDISKRQKKMKQDKKMKEDQKKQQDDVDMDVQATKEEKDEKQQEEAMAFVEEDEEEDSTENKDDTKQQKEDDLQEELDNIVSNWKTIVGSHKLALELVANLCSGINGNGEDEEEADMYQDDDEHMWDSDDEAKLVADSKGATDNNGANAIISPLEQAMYNSMTAQHHLPEKVLHFFRKWVEFLPDTTNVPALVSQDVNEVLSTCALCLGNVLACNLSTWSSIGSEKNGLDFFWLQLVTMLSSSTETSNPESTTSQPHAITSVILSMLQNQPRSRTLVDETTLNGLFTLLLHADANEALMQTQCNIISILGVLCSEPHPASIDAKVCSALLQRLSRSSIDDTNSSNNNQASMKQSVIITHEILNTLMDMYGDEDNCHDEVFDKENVLDHFKRCLPGFKRRIKKVNAAANITTAKEEVNVWNETALNTSRFIKYKQNGG